MNSPADVVYETMNLDMRVLEVDPIHRRIVLGGDEHSGGAAAASGDAVEDHPDGVGRLQHVRPDPDAARDLRRRTRVICGFRLTKEVATVLATSFA